MPKILLAVSLLLFSSLSSAEDNATVASVVKSYVSAAFINKQYRVNEVKILGSAKFKTTSGSPEWDIVKMAMTLEDNKGELHVLPSQIIYLNERESVVATSLVSLEKRREYKALLVPPLKKSFFAGRTPYSSSNHSDNNSSVVADEVTIVADLSTPYSRSSLARILTLLDKLGGVTVYVVPISEGFRKNSLALATVFRAILDRGTPKMLVPILGSSLPSKISDASDEKEAYSMAKDYGIPSVIPAITDGVLSDSAFFQKILLDGGIALIFVNGEYDERGDLLQEVADKIKARSKDGK